MTYVPWSLVRNVEVPLDRDGLPATVIVPYTAAATATDAVRTAITAVRISAHNAALE